MDYLGHFGMNYLWTPGSLKNASVCKYHKSNFILAEQDTVLAQSFGSRDQAWLVSISNRRILGYVLIENLVLIDRVH